jgi:hypothetical protein
MAEIEKYKICFGGHTKPITFPTQGVLADWIYDKMCEKIPRKLRPLERITSIKRTNGTDVAPQTTLHIWRLVERRRDREKNAPKTQ